MIEKICLILLLNFAFFFKTLGFKYCSDDIPSSQRGKNPMPLKHWYLVLEGHEKSSPLRDHALTMFLHAMVCVGIYMGFGHTDISFMAALLFSVNPSNNQGSVWISGRGYALSALGMTWSMALPFMSPIFLLICTYSNAGFLSPIAFIGSSHPWFVLLLPVMWFIHGRNFKKNVKDKMDHEMFTEDKAIKPEKFVLAVKTFGFYAMLALIPFKNTFYHSFLQSASGSGKEKAYTMKDRFFWIGVAFMVAIVYYWTAVPWNMASFGILWWIICIAPFLNIIRMQQEIAERYIYLPNVGLMMVLATFIGTNPVLFTLFFCMYLTKMWFLMDMYEDDYYLLESSCLYSPQSWFAWHVRGMKRWDNQSYQEAVIIWTMARLLSPQEFKINFNLATALAMSKHSAEAQQFLKIAEDCMPSGQEGQCKKLIEDWRKGHLSIVL